MKTITIILGLALICAISFSQTTVRMTSETIGFWTLNGDTMQIVKADKVISGSIYVPGYATDSVTISGCKFTIDSIVTNGIKIPPGEASIDFGFHYALSDSIKIQSPGESWLMLLIKKD